MRTTSTNPLERRCIELRNDLPQMWQMIAYGREEARPSVDPTRHIKRGLSESPSTECEH